MSYRQPLKIQDASGAQATAAAADKVAKELTDISKSDSEDDKKDEDLFRDLSKDLNTKENIDSNSPRVATPPGGIVKPQINPSSGELVTPGVTSVEGTTWQGIPYKGNTLPVNKSISGFYKDGNSWDPLAPNVDPANTDPGFEKGWDGSVNTDPGFAIDPAEQFARQKQDPKRLKGL